MQILIIIFQSHSSVSLKLINIQLKIELVKSSNFLKINSFICVITCLFLIISSCMFTGLGYSEFYLSFTFRVLIFNI